MNSEDLLKSLKAEQRHSLICVFRKITVNRVARVRRLVSMFTTVEIMKTQIEAVKIERLRDPGLCIRQKGT